MAGKQNFLPPISLVCQSLWRKRKYFEFSANNVLDSLSYVWIEWRVVVCKQEGMEAGMANSITDPTLATLGFPDARAWESFGSESGIRVLHSPHFRKNGAKRCAASSAICPGREDVSPITQDLARLSRKVTRAVARGWATVG